jgi:hypothetical protein
LKTIGLSIIFFKNADYSQTHNENTRKLMFQHVTRKMGKNYCQIHYLQRIIRDWPSFKTYFACCGTRTELANRQRENILLLRAKSLFLVACEDAFFRARSLIKALVFWSRNLKINEAQKREKERHKMIQSNLVSVYH